MKRVGIQLIPDFSEELVGIFKIWNSSQDNIQFYGYKPKRSYEIKLLTEPTKGIHFYEALSIGHQIKEEIAPQTDDIIILFTERRLFDDTYYQLYFMGVKEIAIMSLNFSKRLFEESPQNKDQIFQAILINILAIISHKFGMKSHVKSRVCIMDFLNKMSDIMDIISLGPRYCDACSKTILERGDLVFLNKLASSTTTIPNIEVMNHIVASNLFADKIRTIEPEESFDYDVALSFAGEDRQIVEEIAHELKNFGLKVFYDSFEQAKLWGKNLYIYLSDIYRLKARYCIMFLSESYKKKLWTNHEREAAQNRAFHESREYILPIRLDDTEIPGMLDTISYLDWRRDGSEVIIRIIREKLEAQ